MKNFLTRIFGPGLELRRFWRSPMSAAAIVVAVLIPLLYGALYLWAFWNPAGHIDRIPVAVVNQDTGASSSSGEAVHAGDDVVAKLKDSGSMKWEVADPSTAAAGLPLGHYYAVLTIPAGFSQSIATAGTDHAVQAPLQVSYDDANGYTARTVVSTVLREVRASVADSVGQAMVSKVLVGVTDTHAGLLKASDGASQLADGAGTASQGSQRLSDGSARLADGAQTLSSSVAQAHDGAGRVATGASQLNGGIQQLNTAAATLATGAQQLASQLPQAQSGASTLADKSGQLADGAVKLGAGLDQLSRQTQSLPDLTSKLNQGAQSVADGNAKLAAALSAPPSPQQTQAIAQFTATLSPAQAQAFQQIMGGITKSQAQAAASATQLSQGASQVASGTSTLSTGMTSLAQAVAQLDTGAGQVSSGATQLSDGAHNLSDGLSAAVSGSQQLAQGASQLAQGTQTLADKAPTLATGAQNLDDGLGRLTDGSAQLATSAGTLHDGASSLNDGLQKLTTGSGGLRDQLSSAASQVPDWNADQVKDNARVMSDPVGLDTSYTHEADGVGEGFAPYFIGLALYVGSLVMWMMLRPISSRSLAAPVPDVSVVMNNLKPAILLGVAQSLMLTTVLKLGLYLETSHLVAFVLFAMLVSAGFVTLLQTLNIWFGTAVGRLLTLVLLMLQLTSAGGTYPIQTTPGFFQALHAFLPMTQVVNGFRQAVTGDLNHLFWIAVLYFLGMIGGAVLLSIWGASRKRVWSISRLHPAITL